VSLPRHALTAKERLTPEEAGAVTYFDRETVSLLKTVLDRVWATVPPGERAKTSQSLLAERILQAAAQGERDPERLCSRAPMNRACGPLENCAVRRSLATLWAGIFRRAGERAQGRGLVLSDHSEDGTNSGEPRDTWVTDLLARASRGVANDEQDFTPGWAPTQSGGGK
jgi:hypothetical protein